MNKTFSLQSFIVEYATKIAMIIYILSAFYYSETLDPTNNFDTSVVGIIKILKLVVFILISIVLLAVRGSLFKKIGFLLVIVAAFYKILIQISQDNFYWHQILLLSDSLVVIGLSIFYSYRHTMKVKYTEKKRERRKSTHRIKQMELDEQV